VEWKSEVTGGGLFGNIRLLVDVLEENNLLRIQSDVDVFSRMRCRRQGKEAASVRLDGRFPGRLLRFLFFMSLRRVLGLQVS
jgi:hypothetical protein